MFLWHVLQLDGFEFGVRFNWESVNYFQVFIISVLSAVNIEILCTLVTLTRSYIRKLEMWANAQRDGRPVDYRWRPLFNAAVWLTPTTKLPCSNAAKTRNPLKFAGVPQTRQRVSAASRPKFPIL